MGIEALQSALLEKVSYLPENEVGKIRDAIKLARTAHKGQKRENGTAYITHPLGVALLLAEWHADADTITAGILHDAIEDTEVTERDIVVGFGSGAAELVLGVTKFTKAEFAGQESLDSKVETLRKLFEVMRSDIRVAVIKLADRLHNVRCIADLPEERAVRFAKETLDVYYKLAYHLGMNELRRELSDYCMPLVFPQHTEKLLRERTEAMVTAGTELHAMEKEVRQHDTSASMICLQIQPHSLYTMRMHRESPSGDDVSYVYVAIARDLDGCYELLKLFHTLYHPVSARFRDYIAVPAENSYQTIRTTVIGPQDELIPIRIRTAQMDLQERQGILLNCFAPDDHMGPGFTWLQRSEDVDASTRESSQAFWEALKSDILQMSIRISINGEMHTIPAGSTVLDGIYSHFGAEASRTIQHSCIGATVSLSHILEEDDNIAVKLDARPHLTYEWLGKVATSYARSQIVNSLRQRGQHVKLTLGQRLLQRELDHFGGGLLANLSATQKQEVCDHFERSHFEDVIGMVGEGLLDARDIVLQLFPEQVHTPLLGKKKPINYPFRICIEGASDRQHTILPQVLALANLHDTTIQKTTSRLSTTTRVRLNMNGVSPDRLRFADFLSSVERHEDVSNVQILLSKRQLYTLSSVFLFALGVIILDVLLLPFAQHLSGIPVLLRNILPLIPIIAVNHLVLRILERTFAALRSDRWCIGLGFLLNIGGAVLVSIGQQLTHSSDILWQNMILVFILSAGYIGVRMFHLDTVFHQAQHQRLAVQ